MNSFVTWLNIFKNQYALYYMYMHVFSDISDGPKQLYP